MVKLLALLDRKLARSVESLQQGRRPTGTAAHFEADARKDGGAYRRRSGVVKKIDLFERIIVFMGENGRSEGAGVPIDDVVDIRSG